MEQTILIIAAAAAVFLVLTLGIRRRWQKLLRCQY